MLILAIIHQFITVWCNRVLVLSNDEFQNNQDEDFNKSIINSTHLHEGFSKPTINSTLLHENFRSSSTTISFANPH